MQVGGVVAVFVLSVLGVAAPVQAESAPLAEPPASSVPAPAPPPDPTPTAVIQDPSPGATKPVQSQSDVTAEGTLVLFDTAGDWGHLGGLYAQMAANLSSRFGRWDSKPVTEYRAGEMGDYRAVLYVGSTYDEPLPTEFLDDVLAQRSEVIWMGANIWQLHARAAQDRIPGYFIHQFGWQYTAYDFSVVEQVAYKGQLLGRNGMNKSGILNLEVADPARVDVLARAVRDDGSTFPWAVRSDSLTYLGEVPFSYIDEDDRYLIFADLLFDDLDPQAETRHRGMVRIEDVSPDSDPAELRRVADILFTRGVPFSVAVFPVHVRADGTRRTLSQTPNVVAALHYMSDRGGTLLQHGYTHQYSSQANPYDGASGADFEFFMAHVDADDRVVLDGPVADDSPEWVGQRMRAAAAEMSASGVPAPQIWEFPHYAASLTAYRQAANRFAARYDRGMYFSEGRPDEFAGQFFPYEVTDVYGSRVIPENIGNISPEAYNQHRPVGSDELIDRAQANLVVRDGFASFFFHPFLDPAKLAQAVDGIKDLGYVFVSPQQVLSEFPGNAVDAPAAPTGLTVTASQNSADVAFTQPESAVPANAYEYSINGGATWVVVPAMQPLLRIGGLNANTAYTVLVRARNAGGVSASEERAFVTPRATVPGVPTALTVKPGNRELAISFTAPEVTGGTPITGYRYSVDAGKSWTPSPAGTQPAFTIAGLTGNTRYSVRVRAVNAVGAGPATASVAATPGPYVPGVPTGLSAAAGDATATLRFVAPASDGGEAIIGYQFSVDNGVTWQTPPVPVTTSPLTISGLVNGTSYRVRIRAVNVIGPGPASTSVTVRPRR